MSGAEITAALCLWGLYGFSKLLTCITEKCSLWGQHEGFGNEEPLLPTSAYSHGTQVGRAGLGGCLQEGSLRGSPYPWP